MAGILQGKCSAGLLNLSYEYKSSTQKNHYRAEKSQGLNNVYKLCKDYF